MTEHNVHCPYCSSFLADRSSRAPYDIVLTQTKNFVVVPTRGSLIEGWLLIVPKRHILSLAQLCVAERHEFESLVGDVSARVGHLWGVPPTLFEHGASYNGDLIGCGVNHAHLHMAPLDFFLSTAIARSDANIGCSWKSAGGGASIPIPYDHWESYLFYQEPNNYARIAYPEAKISQYFRRVIAAHLGMPERYDYKQHAFYTQVDHTIQMYLGENTARTCIAGQLEKAV